ncbi:hypothetical protein ZOSMA_307G00260, partial [Zostera marina]
MSDTNINRLLLKRPIIPTSEPPFRAFPRRSRSRSPIIFFLWTLKDLVPEELRICEVRFRRRSVSILPRLNEMMKPLLLNLALALFLLKSGLSEKAEPFLTNASCMRFRSNTKM